MLLLRQLIALCLLRIGPQDLPGNPRLLWILAASYILSGGLMFMDKDGFATGMMQAALDAVLLAGFVWVALRVREHPERFNQTYAAMMGINLVITLLSWPVVSAAPIEVVANELHPAQIGLLALLVWNLIAQGQVLRRALDTSAGVGLLLVFIYFMLSSLTIAALFSGSAPA
jgi:drug/metabolite transporter superfamily protein YnfA